MIHELIEKLDPRPKSELPFPRCEHRSPAGRQCSQPICSTSLRFCLTHKPRPEELLIAELTEAAGKLSNPDEINRFLTRVVLLRVQGRLTPKEASNYAYLCLILQRGQRESAYHQKLLEARAQREAEQASRDSVMNWSIPRPDRGDPSDPPTDSRPEPSAEPPAASTSAPSADSGSAPSTPPVAAGLACTQPQSARPSSSENASPITVPETSSNSAFSAAPLASEASTSPKPSAPKKSSSAKTAPSQSTAAVASPRPADFYNHFHPIDLTLPPGSQDLRKNVPPPDADECARLARRRGLDFARQRKPSSGFSLFRR
ncbi:MAG TPA: hypothetical protein VL128_18470 [Candidatus Eisenbacteria bacterium]|nr:hypothetical protein [Candidatus Eisenbacteria bacterium]